jgi:dephospho-CoA kinase
MRLYGLTGGIASGKSTVAGMLRELGAPVMDADAIARRLTRKGEAALVEIGARFPGVVDPTTGELDRTALARRVFADPTERLALEALLHPKIGAAMLEEARALAAAGHPLAFYEAALIFEKNLDPTFDGVVLVTAGVETQLHRLMQRDHLSLEDARRRIAAQMPLAEKAKRATVVIDSETSLEDLRSRVAKVYEQLERKPEARA